MDYEENELEFEMFSNDIRLDLACLKANSKPSCKVYQTLKTLAL